MKMDKRKTAAPNRRRPCFRRFVTRAVLIALVLVIARPVDAYAYIDPSTTSYFLQWLLAALIGAAFALRIFWRNLKSYFTRLFSDGRKSEPDRDE